MSAEEDLDQGFNDVELADIMSEIESLEAEFTEDVEKTSEDIVAVEDTNDTAQNEVEDSANSVTEPVEDIVAEPVEDVVAEVAVEAVSEIEETASDAEIEDEIMKELMSDDSEKEPLDTDEAEPVAMSNNEALKINENDNATGNLDAIESEVESIADETVAVAIDESTSDQDEDDPFADDQLNAELGIKSGDDDLSALTTEEKTDKEKTELQKKMDEEFVSSQYAAEHFGKDSTETKVEPIVENNLNAVSSSNNDLLDAKSKHDSNAPSGKTQMDFCVSGEMQLNLRFSMKKNQVRINLDEKGGLVITLDNGTTLTVPSE